MGMIKLPEQSVSYFEDHYSEIFESGNLAEGKWISEVASWATEYTGAPFAHAVNSNGSGIFSILNILSRYFKKRRIFLQSNTMYGVRTMSITSGLELCGYVDCDLNYLMPTYDQVVDFVSRLDKPSECVFLITHIGGWVNPDIEKIAEFCRDKNIALIEDCAHSLGSTLKGKHTGLFGDAGVYSLYSTKAVPAGEGGIIVTTNEDLHNKVSKFSIYDRFDQVLDVGVNNRMSEINALLSFAVLKSIDEIIENKYKIANEYVKACEQYGWEYIHPTANDQRSNLYKFILLSRAVDPGSDFSQVKTKTSPVYDYALGFDPQEVSRRHICLPIWYKLETEVIGKVVAELER
jgi:dTDP-4-amino-4,6-dideoxygalactose transaminase